MVRKTDIVSECQKVELVLVVVMVWQRLEGTVPRSNCSR